MTINPIRQKAYKIVSVDTQLDRLMSAVVWQESIATEYHRDKITRAKVGKLFVFASLPDAQIFAHNNFGSVQRFQIWEVEAYKAEIAHTRLDVAALKWVEKFWKDKSSIYDAYIEETPKGTLLCSSLRMIRRWF
jgi:hypothetical protein